MSGGGFLSFLDKILFNKNRDMFTVRLGSALVLSQLGIVGFANSVAGRIFRGVIGLFLELGIYSIDLTLDAWREGRKLKEFEEIATKTYNETIAKVHDEAKKNEIRKTYLAIISKIGPVGTGPR